MATNQFIWIFYIKKEKSLPPLLIILINFEVSWLENK